MVRRPTLIEVVVVLFILGMLWALMLPASMAVRDSARRNAKLIEGLSGGEPPAAAADAPSPADSRIQARFVYFQEAPNVPRKIIYEAEISLVVDKLSDTEAKFTKLLKQVDGYIAEASVDRREGEQLSGRWRVRVPVAQFDSFLDAVSKFGVAESRRQTAQDVTEEFVDIEAQIANKKKLEERIVALLKDTTGKITDVIEVERELARVRGELEQMEGRLRYLTNRTDLTTVSITAREDENYVPPAAPTFVDRIVQAWNTSLLELREFGERSVVGLVYVAPWIAVVGVVGVPALILIRMRNAKIRKRANSVTQTSGPST